MMRNRVSKKVWPFVWIFSVVVPVLLAVPGWADDDKDADRLFEQAESSYKLERWKEASKRYYDFMVAAPDDSRNDRAQFYAARAYHQRNYPNKAIKEYEYVLEDFPNSVYAYLAQYYLGRALIATREAEAGYERLWQFIKDYEPTKKHDYPEDDLKGRLRGRHKKAVLDVAENLREKEEYEKAISAYLELPNQLEAFRRVVDVRYELGQYDRILEMIEDLEGRDEHEAFKYMMEFYANRKAYRRLKEIYRELLRKEDPDGQTDELVWHAKKMFKKFGEQHLEEALKMIGEHYPRLARRAQFELAERNKDNRGYMDEFELFILAYRNEDERTVQVENRYKINDVDQVLRWKGRLLEQGGEAEKAREEYLRMENAAQGHWYRAESYHGRYARDKNMEAALEEYEELKKSFYSEYWSAMAHWRIARLLEEMEQYEEAVETYREFDERWPELQIGGADGQNGQLKGILRHNIGKGKMEFAPAALLQCGDMLREAERVDEAIQQYRDLNDKYPNSDEAPWGIYRTALCYEDREDSEMAVEVLKSLLRQYGKSRAAARASERLHQKYDIADPYVEDTMDFTDIVN